ncbi:21358_t:CDS:1, partial [Racocetra persica]
KSLTESQNLTEGLKSYRKLNTIFTRVKPLLENITSTKRGRLSGSTPHRQ